MKSLKEKLADAGFAVVDNEVKSLWKPDEEDYAKVPALVQGLLE